MHGFVFYRGHVFLSTHGDVPTVLKENIISHFYCCYWVLHCCGILLPTFNIALPCLNAFVCLFLNSGKVQWVSLRTEHEYITVIKNNISTRSPLPFNKSFHLSLIFGFFTSGFHYGIILQETVKRGWTCPGALQSSGASIQFSSSFPHCLKTHMASSVFCSETEQVRFAEGQGHAAVALSP